MPQMAPINWLFLYFLFIMIFLFFNFLNYYLFLYQKKLTQFKNYKNIMINWKW